ncbi:MAG: hypothetical protein WD557_01130 [Dehalococcoidia bacterium]
MPSSLRYMAAGLLSFLFVIAFLAALLAIAIRTRVAQPEFYTNALRDAEVYDRLYSDLLQDPEFGRGRDSLLGNMSFPAQAAVRVVERVVPAERLQAATTFVVDALVKFVRDGGQLDLRLDISAFVERIQSIVPEEAEAQVEAAPSETVADDEGLLARVDQSLAELGDGRFPAALPAVQELADNTRQRVSDVIVTRANLDASDPDDAQTIAAVDTQLSDGNVGGAIKAAVGPAIDARLAEARETITDSGWVQQDDAGGDTTYYLVPAPRVQERIETRLEPVHTIYVASLWIAIGGIAFMLGAAALLAFLFRQRPVVAFRWLGTTLIVASVVAVLVWVVGLYIAREELESFLAPSESDLPEAFQGIVRDVLQQARESLGLVFWVPGMVAAVAGIGLWVASLRPLRPAHGTAETPPAH